MTNQRFSLLKQPIKFIPFLFLTTMFALMYLTCIQLGAVDFLQDLLSKMGVSLGSRILLPRGLDCSGSLAFAIGFALKVLLTTGVEPLMMNPSDASTSTPVDPNILLDENVRKKELLDRLRIHNLLENRSSIEVEEQIAELQVEIEKKIEQALLSDGYAKDSLVAKRNAIRGFIFYPHGTLFSSRTYGDYLDSMNQLGTHRSLPYRRLMEAISRYDIFLDLEFGIKKTRW